MRKHSVLLQLRKAGRTEEACRRYGWPLDNLTADHGHIEGRTDDMRHKAQLPSGKMISASSTQQLVDKAWTAATTQQPEKQPPLLEDYANHWFEVFKRPEIRPTTARDYECTIKRHIIPAFGKLRLNEIDTAMIKQFLTEKEQKPYAKSTVKHMRDYLHMIFDSAVEDGFIPKNPAKSSRLKIKGKANEREPVAPQHVREIVSQLDKLEPRDKVFLAILIYTGMRRGEALALKWEDIDFANDTIHVQHSISFPDGNNPVLGPTKSDAGIRFIPLTPELKDILAPARQLSGFITCMVGTREPLTAAAYKNKYGLWSRIAKRIPIIKAEKYTAHQFRHAYATAIQRRGADIKTLQAIMGHSDIKTTMRYVHSDEERIKWAKGLATGMYLEHASGA